VQIRVFVVKNVPLGFGSRFVFQMCFQKWIVGYDLVMTGRNGPEHNSRVVHFQVVKPFKNDFKVFVDKMNDFGEDDKGWCLWPPV
jgi:hypothetical protein